MSIAIDTIYTRHSTRCFDIGFEIPRNTQEKILEAGINAPSPKNRQPWRFIVLDQKKDIQNVADILENRLKQLKAERIEQNRDFTDLDMAFNTSRIIKDVSLLVLICYERDERNEHGEIMSWSIKARPFEVADILSIGACIQNMLLIAESFDIDSLWIGDIHYAESDLSRFFNTEHPIISAVVFGKEQKRRTMRHGVNEKAKWV